MEVTNAIRIVKLTMRGAKILYRTMLRPHQIYIRGNLIRFPKNTGPELSRALYTENYESQELEAMKKIIEPTDRLLDIGASIGHITISACKLIGSARVVAIEANPDLIPFLESNFLANSVNPKLIIGAAASAVHGRNAIFFKSDDFWSSSLLERECQKSETIRVPYVDCGEIIRANNINFLVCDIEGGEATLLPKLDLSNIEKLIIEFHPKLYGEKTYTELLKLLLDQDFIYLPYSSFGYTFAFRRARRHDK